MAQRAKKVDQDLKYRFETTDVRREAALSFKHLNK